MGWIRCVRCEKLQCDFVGRTFVLIDQFSMFCNKFHAVTKRYQMHSNTTKHAETLLEGPIGWIACVRCEKSRREFVAWTFALIALVHRVLHRVWCSYEMIPNTPKYYKGQMGWIECVRCEKSRRHFMARTLALIAPFHPVLHRVSCSYEMIPNAPKYYEGPMGWIGCVSCEKSPCHFVARTFALIAPVHPILYRVSYRYEMIPNAPEHYETHQNMSLRSNRVDQVCLTGKITMWLRGTNFCINCTSSVCFATSFMQLRNDTKCTQILRNMPKHYLRVQLGGFRVSVAKNPDVNSWHELLH